MCGIVGYIGKRKAFPILIKGLHRLEYRGYDSSGCALIDPEGNMHVYKAKGKVSVLESVVASREGMTDSASFASSKSLALQSTLGIAHTRWATHGAPSEVNAHPHTSQSGKITLVHNGIIENYVTIREQLKKRDCTFKSETDTEVLVNLIEYVKEENNLSLPSAVRVALTMVYGAYAIAVIDRDNPNMVVAARKSSPLAIGLGYGNSDGSQGDMPTEFFLGSDASPIAEYTNHIVYLNDEEVAVIELGKDLKVYDLNGAETAAEVKEVNVDLSMLDHEGYPHFMLKEIFDQPNVLRDCMRGRIVGGAADIATIDTLGTFGTNGIPGSNGFSPLPFSMGKEQENNSPYTVYNVILTGVTQNRRRLLRAHRIVIVSCGTSWHAGLIGKQLIEHFCSIPVEIAYASEFRYSDAVIDCDDIVIAISQSGETADTLAAVKKAKEAGAFVYGIVNGVGSSIARASDSGTYIHVGPEIGVASTKAFTGQVVVLTMIALALGMIKDTVTQDEYEQTIAELICIPDKIQKVLEQDDMIKKLSQSFVNVHNCLYLGRGYNYPVALEGALKLKEISYIHAEGYPAAEMKHGPIALVDEELPVIFIATHDKLYQKIISNMQEVISRKGKILAIVTEGDEDVKSMADSVIEIPKTLECLTPLLSVIPLQLLAYHIAVAKGLNVDQPRNLAKSVTVE